MSEPLPQPPSGGYFVIEVNFGYVNNAFINNTINLSGKTSTGLKIDGNTFGDQIIGNQVTYASTWQGVFPPVAMVIGAGTNSGSTDNLTPDQAVPYPLPSNWTTVPNLGVIVDGNTLRDSLGIELGIEPYMAYYSAQDELALSTGRVYFTGSVVSNTFEWDSSLLNATGPNTWQNAFDTDLNQHFVSNDPDQSNSIPTITLGDGVSVDPPSAFGNSRMDWSVGGVDPFTHTPTFIDPISNIVFVQGNSAGTINPDGSSTPWTEPTGQAFAGFVNNFDVSSTVIAQVYDNNPYVAFNVKDYASDTANALNIGTGQMGTTTGIVPPTIQALMLGQDNYDLVGSGSGTPSPDGMKDLHIKLKGLSTTASVQSISLSGDGESWVWPESGSSPQIVFDHPSGTSTADIFIQPTTAQLDGNFTVAVTYQNESGGPVQIPLNGVQFNPLLPVLPGAPLCGKPWNHFVLEQPGLSLMERVRRGVDIHRRACPGKLAHDLDDPLIECERHGLHRQ